MMRLGGAVTIVRGTVYHLLKIVKGVLNTGSPLVPEEMKGVLNTGVPKRIMLLASRYAAWHNRFNHLDILNQAA